VNNKSTSAIGAGLTAGGGHRGDEQGSWGQKTKRRGRENKKKGKKAKASPIKGGGRKI